ncbi:pyridoxal phosphate-dependent aminotransferase [Bdellovibrio sp. HCB337]|uniref:pyridoxal phosphate-dependent aminotransferase n=1 Tax=Bdellovibrio sp. HCB337 TaxID=3394358 RepID=UPI0039A41D0C
MILSKRAQNLKTSPTLFLVAKAKELQAKGHPVISLTVGEPDWPTFPVAARAGQEAIEKGITKYTPANGTAELRQAVADKIKHEIGLEYGVKNVTVASGAKFIIFGALQMLCSPGDEVIINSPYWVSYPTMVELADGVPVVVDCGEADHFKMTPEKLEKAITPKTRVFLFCSPSNPTGLVYTHEELKALAQVLNRHPHVMVISDDMYNRLMFDGSKVAPHILHVAPELKDRVVLVNGGSKAYSMTGWRIGWAVGPEKLITAMGDYQSQSTGSPSSISQYAAVAALKHTEPDIEAVVKTLIQRKIAAMEEFKKVPQLRVIEPQGAFYLWVDMKSLYGKTYKGTKIHGSKDFADILLNEYYVATVPGSECGCDGYLRLSFACSEGQMKEAIQRMASCMAQLS